MVVPTSTPSGLSDRALNRPVVKVELGDACCAGAKRYDWHGAEQRSPDVVGGGILMGARVYNPAVGLFSSIDSVRNGGATRLGYPYDPINGSDLSGLIWWGGWKHYHTYPWTPYTYWRVWFNRLGTEALKVASYALAMLATFAGALTGLAGDIPATAVLAAIAFTFGMIGLFANTAQDFHKCVGMRIFKKKSWVISPIKYWGYMYYSDYACTVS